MTQEMFHAKAAKGLSFAKLAAAFGCSPFFLAAVCYHQAGTTRVQARKMLYALGLCAEPVPGLMGFPVKGGLMPTVPVDPRLYHVHEILRSTVCRRSSPHRPSLPPKNDHRRPASRR